jgi:thioesterase domain-containing protein
MLLPVQTSGSKPPLFIVHDQFGVMPFGKNLAHALGPDQALYIVQADGVEGRRPAIANVPSMALNYMAEVHGARPIGPLLIGGLGSGSLLALELARELVGRGRRIGPVILIDPPPLGGSIAQKPPEHASAAPPGRLLYESVRSGLLDYASHLGNDLPFDARNLQQLHIATLAGIAALTAFANFVPKPFSGATAVLLPSERAEDFFYPQSSWQQLLSSKECIVHVLPWDHAELFQSGREIAMDVVKFLIEEAIEALAEPASEPAESGPITQERPSPPAAGQTRQ